MADMLAGLGRINGDALSQEQLRQLKELLKSEDQTDEDRLWIAIRLAETQWVYDHRDNALITLKSILTWARLPSGRGTPPWEVPVWILILESPTIPWGRLRL